MWLYHIGENFNNNSVSAQMAMMSRPKLQKTRSTSLAELEFCGKFLPSFTKYYQILENFTKFQDFYINWQNPIFNQICDLRSFVTLLNCCNLHAFSNCFLQLSACPLDLISIKNGRFQFEHIKKNNKENRD